MNFLSQPTKSLTPNAPMVAEHMEIATDFIDELWWIGLFELVPEGCELLANAPLFTMPKPGQPGQWCCIADMKSGGQNEHIGKDPVHLLQARWIVWSSYTSEAGPLSWMPANISISSQLVQKNGLTSAVFIPRLVNSFGMWTCPWS